MNNKIQVTILKALYDMKFSWNEKRTDNKYGSLGQRAHECIDKQVEECRDAIKYVMFCEEIETQDIECEEEFTASKMRKRLAYKDNQADLFNIKYLKSKIEERTNKDCDFYLYKYGLSEYVARYFIDRGFIIEYDKRWTKISWYREFE